MSRRRGFSPKAGPDFSRMPAWVKTFALLALANWLLCSVISEFLGGTPFGTDPSVGSFHLLNKGVRTPVSETVWLWSLYYSWLSHLLAVVGIWGVAFYMGRIDPTSNSDDAIMKTSWLKVSLLLLSAFGAVWWILICFNAVDAFRGYLSR
jgi:hypothetical protein